MNEWILFNDPSKTSWIMEGLKSRHLLMWHWQMIKVNEMVMYVSEMKWNLHDNFSHQNDAIFVRKWEERNQEAGTQCPTFMKSLQGVFYLTGHRQPNIQNYIFI